MNKKFNVLFGFLFLFSLGFIIAASNSPTDLTFTGNSTPIYDVDGDFTLNWTAGVGGDAVSNYSIYIFINGVSYLNDTNDSVLGYSFSNSTNGNYTFIVGAVNETTDVNQSSAISMYVDSTAPVITLPEYTNGTLKTNLQTLTLNISVVDTGSGPSACMVDVNGTNQTIEYSDGWCNSTIIALTGLADGNHTIFAYANDTLGTFGLNDSYVVQINDSAYTQAAVDLGTSANFTILSKSGISTTGDTTITGDIGVSPIDSTAITGFGLVMDASNTFATSSLVNGSIYAPDYIGPPATTEPMLGIAVGDMETAYTDANGRTNPVATELGAGSIGGLTLVAGFYDWTTNVNIATDLTLYGDADDVWIFSITGTLDISSATSVVLSGGAQASNIFWAVSDTTTLGTTSQFKGNILDYTNIVIQTGATLNGRALAQTAVTLDANTVSSTGDEITSAAPGITLPLYTNGTAKANSSTLTLNISLSNEGTGRSACVVNVNGTNQTVAYASGWCNTTAIALTGLVDGNYTILVYANDTLNTFALEDTYVVQMDSTNPVITAFTCPDVHRDGTLSCTCTGADNYGVETTLITNTDTNFVGVFDATCTVTDFAGNSVSETTPYSVLSSSSSSGGSGGSSSSSSWINTIISNENLKFGYVFALGTKERVKFNIIGETHYVGILSISGQSALISINSVPMQVNLKVGDEYKADLNDDGFYDLYVLLKGVSQDEAELTVVEIHEPVPKAISPSEAMASTGETTEKSPTTITGNIIGEGGVGKLNIWWVILAVVFVAAVLFILFGKKKKKKRK